MNTALIEKYVPNLKHWIHEMLIFYTKTVLTLIWIGLDVPLFFF